MENVISGIWCAMELGTFCMFWRSHLSSKFKVRYEIMAIAGWWLFIMGYMNRGLPILYRQLITLGGAMIMPFLVYEGKWYRRVLTTILGYLTMGLIDSVLPYGFSWYLGCSFDELIWKKELYISIVTLGKLVELFVAWLLMYVKRKERGQDSDGGWLALLLLFPLVSLGMLMAVFHIAYTNDTLARSAFLLSSILGIANIGIIVVISMVEKSQRTKYQNLLLSQQMEIQTGSITSLEKAYRAQREATHEFQHHLSTLYQLLNQGDVETGKDYLRQLQKGQNTRVLCVNSHHAVIDAILNHKYQQAKEINVDIQFQVNDLSQLNIQMESLVVILCNLLDNAIEACSRLQDQRKIMCSVLLAENFEIVVRNTSDAVTIMDGKVKTTKKLKHEHGYGLMNVERIIEQMHGEYAVSYDDGWFEFVIELPQPAAKK